MPNLSKVVGYDPAKVVADAYRACQAAGLRPTLRDTPGSAGAAIVAATQLLHAIGVPPVDRTGQPERPVPAPLIPPAPVVPPVLPAGANGSARPGEVCSCGAAAAVVVQTAHGAVALCGAGK